MTVFETPASSETPLIDTFPGAAKQVVLNNRYDFESQDSSFPSVSFEHFPSAKTLTDGHKPTFLSYLLKKGNLPIET